MLMGTIKSALQSIFVTSSIKHVHGVKQVRLKDNEAAVTCLVKNGAFYIEQFIDHHLELGFKHIFLLDNNSTDDTVSLALKHPNVSIYETGLQVSKYQGLMKKTLAEKAVSGGWCLDVDIDEFFDFPGSGAIDLSKFIGYLNASGYTVVITQMLDLFSGETMSHLETNSSQDIKSTYVYYDLADVTKTRYANAPLANQFAKDNILANDGIELYFGGIRKNLYGLNCLLTKHSLFSRRAKLDLFHHVHFVNKARVADVTCLLSHYKLTGNAVEQAIQNRDNFHATRSGYEKFINLIRSRPDFRIKRPGSETMKAVDDLVENGFLFASPVYKEYVAALAAQTQHSRQNA
jgi:hypothetical protein